MIYTRGFKPLSEPSAFAPVNELTLVGRLGLALLAGAIIGAEREAKNKAAGLRTHILVSFGSAMFVLIPIQLGAAQQNPDILGRAISGIIGGVSFIGAGTILRSSRVHGLTSAAAIWVSSALGTAIGCGLWLLGLTGSLVALIVLRLLEKLE
ncbi:MgtC/SapB transporter [Crocosphaera chwakensis CCY0110]|uniref:MgtC/SapB transporter n=1 Tax=Crocosphaera chwakensis CCY0110 TaxID=391612 RepID=A3INY4_9CHRO|nr:MgtC/SapB transporter [Crocosphaera chwakensis CCY0110]